MRTRVLVVDDDLATLDVTRRILKLDGYEVLSADGPRQALEIVSNSPPVHLVVADLLMPEMQGTELVREVLRLSPQTAGVLMTGYVTSAANVPAGVALLRKPFTRQELICAVGTALAQSTRSGRSRAAGSA
jgi:DNA-binding NtrC family response regulator